LKFVFLPRAVLMALCTYVVLDAVAH